MITNPFLTIDAGVFCATAASAGESGIAERICATLASAILKQPTKPLAPETWSLVVSKIPELALSGATNGETSLSSADALANVCIGPGIDKTLPAAKAELAKWISSQPALAQLKVIAVALDAHRDIYVSLAFLGQTPAENAQNITFSRSEQIINYSNPEIAKELDQVFTNPGTLVGQPYFCALTPAS